MGVTRWIWLQAWEGTGGIEAAGMIGSHTIVRGFWPVPGQRLVLGPCWWRVPSLRWSCLVALQTGQTPLALLAVCDRVHFWDMVALTASDTETEHWSCNPYLKNSRYQNDVTFLNAERLQQYIPVRAAQRSMYTENHDDVTDSNDAMIECQNLNCAMINQK